MDNNTNCDKCPGRIYPRLTRPIDKRHRPILVIGESVTAIEARSGSVMSGAGAKILVQTMEKVGLPIDSASVAFTTAIHCAVPKIKGKSNPFHPEMLSNCRTRLMREIEEIAPRLILVCGKIAYTVLTGMREKDVKITEEYGRVREFAFLPGTKVIPVMNPGVLVHSPGEYKPFLTMMQLASTIYGGGSEVDTGETRWTVMDTPAKCRDLYEKMWDLNAVGKLPLVSCDIETTGLDYRTAEFLVLGINFERNHTYVIPRDMRKYVHNFLDGAPWRCIWQHGKYDKKVMWRRKLSTVAIDEDVMYMHYVLDETSEHGLGYLSKVYLNAKEYKYKMNQNWSAVSLESYPAFFDALCERVAVDCDYTMQIYNKFRTILDEEPTLDKLYKTMLIPMANFLSRVEENGFAVDAPYLQVLDKKYDVLVDKIKTEVEDIASTFWDRNQYLKDTGSKSAPPRFNPASPKQMSWMVFDQMRLKPRVKKGRSTDKDILETLPELELLKKKEIKRDELSRGAIFVDKVLEYRRVQKEQSTSVQGLLNAMDEDGRVRTNFTVHVTATGRLSSKEPNIQNVPSAHGVGNIRRAFIPAPGYVLAEIDYSGAELRWLAFLSNCPVLMDIFVNGKNLHNETATALFGPHFTKPQKMRAKAVNFGIPYGREYASFMDEFNISKEDAIAMIEGWLNKYYGARDYLQWCADQVIQGNYLETPYGRRRRFGLVTDASLHALQNEARNFPIQSASSDTLSMSCMEMEEPLRTRWGVRILNLVHDSTVLEIPADPQIISEVGQYANKVMVNKPIELFNCPVPFKTDFEVGNTWGDLMAFDYNLGAFIPDEDEPGKLLSFDDWARRVREGVHFGH